MPGGPSITVARPTYVSPPTTGGGSGRSGGGGGGGGGGPAPPSGWFENRPNRTKALEKKGVDAYDDCVGAFRRRAWDSAIDSCASSLETYERAFGPVSDRGREAREGLAAAENAKANELFRRGRCQDAAALYQRAAGHDPGNVAYARNLGGLRELPCMGGAAAAPPPRPPVVDPCQYVDGAAVAYAQASLDKRLALRPKIEAEYEKVRRARELIQRSQREEDELRAELARGELSDILSAVAVPFEDVMEAERVKELIGSEKARAGLKAAFKGVRAVVSAEVAHDAGVHGAEAEQDKAVFEASSHALGVQKEVIVAVVKTGGAGSASLAAFLGHFGHVLEVTEKTAVFLHERTSSRAPDDGGWQAAAGFTLDIAGVFAPPVAFGSAIYSETSRLLARRQILQAQDNLSTALSTSYRAETFLRDKLLQIDRDVTELRRTVGCAAH